MIIGYPSFKLQILFKGSDEDEKVKKAKEDFIKNKPIYDALEKNHELKKKASLERIKTENAKKKKINIPKK